MILIVGSSFGLCCLFVFQRKNALGTMQPVATACKRGFDDFFCQSEIA